MSIVIRMSQPASEILAQELPRSRARLDAATMVGNRINTMLERKSLQSTDRYRGEIKWGRLWSRLALRLAVASFALATYSTGARAAEFPPALASILNTQATRQAVIETAREQNRQLPDACGSATYTEAPRAVVLIRPQDDATGKLTAGAWQQSVIAAGCGTPRQLNVLTLVQADGTLRHVALLSGATIAGPLLQRDAVQYARAATAALIPRDCREGRVVDTRFDVFEGRLPTSVQPGRLARRWREDWTIEGSGKRAVVRVHFIPDPTGTTIVANSKEARPG